MFQHKFKFKSSLFVGIGLIGLILASCAQGQEGTDFPSRAQYQQVVNTLNGQILNADKIIRAFEAHGVRRPHRITTGVSNQPGTTLSATVLSWQKGTEYSVSVSFGYNSKAPFSATDPARGNHSYTRSY